MCNGLYAWLSARIWLSILDRMVRIFANLTSKDTLCHTKTLGTESLLAFLGVRSQGDEHHLMLKFSCCGQKRSRKERCVWNKAFLLVPIYLFTLQRYSSFSITRHFLPNPGRILPALTYNFWNPLNVNTGRILPWFGRKWRIIEKLEHLWKEAIERKR